MESITTDEVAPATKPKKWPLILFVILTIVFFLGTAALSYLYWQKDKNFKNVNQQNQENQQKADQLIKDKADLEKQVADLTKENGDLKAASGKSAE